MNGRLLHLSANNNTLHISQGSGSWVPHILQVPELEISPKGDQRVGETLLYDGRSPRAMERKSIDCLHAKPRTVAQLSSGQSDSIPRR